MRVETIRALRERIKENIMLPYHEDIMAIMALLDTIETDELKERNEIWALRLAKAVVEKLTNEKP